MDSPALISGRSLPIPTRAPAWAVGVLAGVLLWSLISDLHGFWVTRYDGSRLWWLLAGKTVLDHAALALAGRFPYPAAVLVWCALPVTVATGYVGMTTLSLPGVTVAVLAVCRVRFAAIHAVIAAGWVVAHGIAGPAGSSWTVLLFLIPAVAIGLLIRYFLVRAAGERERLRVATQSLTRVRDQERAELSRELHDAVASGLALISMETTSVEDSTDPDELRSALATVRQVSRDTSAELRLLVRTLREPASPDTLAVDGFAGSDLAAVTHHLTGPLTDRGYPVSVTLTGLAAVATDDLLPAALHTYRRIVQESVTNIIKHTPPGTSCRFAAEATGTTLHLRIGNDLPAGHATPPPGSGIGLRGVQERAALTSGSVSYGPRGDEWVVEARLPLRPHDLR